MGIMAILKKPTPERPAYPPLVALRCRGGWYGPWRPGGWSTVLAPPLSALPLTALSKSSRHGTPHRLNALNTTAAFWEQGVRHSAGTVRMRCRALPPAWSRVLTWLTQFSTWTVAHRQHHEA